MGKDAKTNFTNTQDPYKNLTIIFFIFLISIKIIETTILPKVLYTVKAIPIKITMTFLGTQNKY